MRIRRRALQATALTTGVAAVVAGTKRANVARGSRRVAARLDRKLRYRAGRLRGAAYHLAGRHPDPDVTDDILADRIRSEIGPVEKRLDIPHVHVMVEDHVAVLHGDVTGESDIRALEHAILAVSGVRGVESHLHTGLVAGDTRPSASHADVPS